VKRLLAIGFAAILAVCYAGHASAKDARLAAFETAIVSVEDLGKPNPKTWSIQDRMAAYGVAGTGVAIIEKGKIVWAQGYGVLSANEAEPANAQSIFSAGSVSKLINAALILRLVQAGQINLDVDVNRYLTSWKVPESEFTRAKKVTLRMLLSHTSGFSQSGFPDFEPGEPLPTLLQTLNGQPPAKHKAVVLTYAPGTRMQYSGGGVQVSQLAVENVTGMSYGEAAQKYVFAPLGMTRSTFQNPLSAGHGNIAKAHDKTGKARALPRGYESMPELAASGLWISAEDLAIFVNALMNDRQFLSDGLRKDMLTRVPRSWHGLGPRLNGSGEKFVFHHGGANNSYQSIVEGHPTQGNGIVVLTNGEAGRALAYEIRIAVGQALGWSIRFPEDFEEPKFN
jgi:CubicO group peptidase (beta-lactamase class C family)